MANEKLLSATISLINSRFNATLISGNSSAQLSQNHSQLNSKSYTDLLLQYTRELLETAYTQGRFQMKI